MAKLLGCLPQKEQAEAAMPASRSSSKQKLRAWSNLLLRLGSPKENKKATPSPPLPWEQSKGGAFASAAAVKVKLVITKKEAAQLLAMFVRGEEAAVGEILGKMESRKARRTGSGSGPNWRPMLESIPEH